MRLLIALSVFLFVGSTQAEEVSASEASILELMEITQARKMSENMIAQLDVVMQNMIDQVAGDESFMPGEKAAVDNMRAKVAAVVSGQLSWSVMEPDLIQIYREAFTQSEVTQMIEFYRTAAGQAIISKMPLVMQRAMESSQVRMQAVLPVFDQIQREFVEEVAACRAAKVAEPPQL